MEYDMATSEREAANQRRPWMRYLLVGSVAAVAILAMALAGGVFQLSASHETEARPSGGALINAQGTPEGQDPQMSNRATGEGTEAPKLPPTPRPRVIRGRVLFAAPANLASALEPSFTEAGGRAVVVSRASNQAELEAALAADVTAIIIESSLANRLDWQWIQDRFVEGRVIVGLNVSMGELIDRLYPAVKPMLPDLGWQRNEPAFFKPGERSYAILFTGGPTLDLSYPTCSGGFENAYGEEWDEGGLIPLLREAITCAVPETFGG
jgi:hypothetical protein